MSIQRRAFLKASLALPLMALIPGAWSSMALATAPTETPERISLAVHSSEGPHRVDVEVASTAAQRQRGLMGREHLPEEAGMLFLYTREQAGHNGFWMYQTLIPLDIAFINTAGNIVAIRTMQPCESESPGGCRSYSPGAPYAAALEVNAGYFAERGIREGDCVALPGKRAGCSR